LLSVFEVGSLDSCFKGERLGFSERLFAARIKTARVFSRRSERQREEVRGQLIMLLIGGPNVQGDRKLIHFADEFDFARPRSAGKGAARPVDKRSDSQF
jgi:hypothetical protein